MKKIILRIQDEVCRMLDLEVKNKGLPSRNMLIQQILRKHTGYPSLIGEKKTE